MCWQNSFTEVSVILELQSLSKSYGRATAVNQLTLSLNRGEFFSLVGPSGCGKTTTLRMVAGFEEPNSGEILLDGKPIRHLAPYERDVTTVFQNYALFPHLSVAANIAFGLERRGSLGKTAIRQKIAAMVELLQLEGKENRLPQQLSGGEKQRVALARALVMEPSVLLLDEPLSALDPQLRKHVRSELKSLQRKLGITFLFITHDQEEALHMSDRIGVMCAGQLQQVGTGEALYRRPRTRFVAEFLGDVNWMRPNCGVRPEHLRVRVPAGGQRGDCVTQAVVEEIEFLGSRWLVSARMPNGQVCRAEQPGDTDTLTIGSTADFWWEHCHGIEASIEE